MAKIASAKKQARQNEKRRLKNIARKTSIKTAIKKVLTALKNKEPNEQTKVLLRDAEAKLARSVSKNVLHRNTVRRKVSKLAKQVAKAQKTAASL